MTNLPEDSAPLGLYIHWPFCLSKCPYCDFNSHVRDRIDQKAWRDALLLELESAAADLPGRKLESIFFGGGTPSLMDPDTVGDLVKEARSHWLADPDLEVTLEANPTSVETARLKAYRDAGVNRVSLGVQALDEDALRFLGREHSTGSALDAVAEASSLFPRYSFDMIYARPTQTLLDWQGELRRALDFAAAHISVYQLTIEPGTAFQTRYRKGEFSLPEEDVAAAMFDMTQEVLGDAGLPAYEISNHARPGEESRHNLIYWRYHDWVGIGPGAHGRVTRDGVRSSEKRYRLPEKWLTTVQENGHGLEETVVLETRDRFEECLMMGLRLTEGVSLETLKAQDPDSYVALMNSSANTGLIDEGYVIWTDTHLKASAEGRLRLNAVIDHLLT